MELLESGTSEILKSIPNQIMLHFDVSLGADLGYFRLGAQIKLKTEQSEAWKSGKVGRFVKNPYFMQKKDPI